MKKPVDLPEGAEGEVLPETTQAGAAEAVAEPLHPSLPMDEYHGLAGSYLYDPTTGKRTPLVSED